MNKKGITLITVVVMIVVMLIIATASILAGNQLLVNSSEYKKEQEIQAVKAAVSRKKSQAGMQGTITPIGDGYVGAKNPILLSDENGTLAAEGWFLLDKNSLEELGIYDVDTKYLANYDYEIVLSTEDPNYIEEYSVITFMHEYKEIGATAGTALKNRNDSDTSGAMVIDKSTGDVYGTGWYVVEAGSNNVDGTSVVGEFPDKYAPYIKNTYLVNFDTLEYVKWIEDLPGITVGFEYLK